MHIQIEKTSLNVESFRDYTYDRFSYEYYPVFLQHTVRAWAEIQSALKRNDIEEVKPIADVSKVNKSRRKRKKD